MLKGKIALVTGGGRGIGAHTAMLMARNGAHVYICSRSGQELDETGKLVEKAGGKVEKIICDLQVESQIVSMFKMVDRGSGRLDVLVNAAGEFKAGKMEGMSTAEFRRAIDVNCTATFICCREAFPLMKQNGGSIINISSLSGVKGSEKFPGFGPYIVSKHGVVGITEALAVEWKNFGIRVNCIAPGAVDTAMLQDAAPNLYPRLSPEQVAETILYFASSMSSGVNGSVLEMFSHLQQQ
ncbi:MAG: SDR family oxidoreductase [Nitrospinota bacterium]|nr:SDR family oxidoreductase [Nitrospinota bacterium]